LLERPPPLRVLSWHFLAEEIFKMDRHDQELLDKQVRHVQPATRYEGAAIAIAVSVFFAGVVVGGLLFSSNEPVSSAPMQVASNDAMPTMAQLFGAPIRR
jgi:hypothetical protein